MKKPATSLFACRIGWGNLRRTRCSPASARTRLDPMIPANSSAVCTVYPNPDRLMDGPEEPGDRRFRRGPERQAAVLSATRDWIVNYFWRGRVAAPTLPEPPRQAAPLSANASLRLH